MNQVAMIMISQSARNGLPNSTNRDSIINSFVALDSIKPLPKLEHLIRQYAEKVGLSLHKGKLRSHYKDTFQFFTYLCKMSLTI
jgi:hypothetical protein